MKGFLNLLRDNAWTYAGTAMVLITLSGATFRQALGITLAALLIHSALSIANKDV